MMETKGFSGDGGTGQNSLMETLDTFCGTGGSGHTGVIETGTSLAIEAPHTMPLRITGDGGTVHNGQGCTQGGLLVIEALDFMEEDGEEADTVDADEACTMADTEGHQ